MNSVGKAKMAINGLLCWENFVGLDVNGMEVEPGESGESKWGRRQKDIKRESPINKT
jgi:energy-converting hydrogenase Eha subunit B